MNFEPDFTVISLPSVKADPARDGTHSETFILVNLGRRIVIIGGTGTRARSRSRSSPRSTTCCRRRTCFRCTARPTPSRDGDDVALFFGLSGTGKTTLSADPSRRLIGDDEHGWSDRGIFNFEGGCYAKTIRIRKESEPEIYAATESFGTILENVVFDPRTRVPDYDSEEKTENTRAAYPIDLIPNAVLSGTGQHPHNVIFLSADAYGVLPPVARLDEDQIRHYFLSGYTAKVAGTERGVTEPEPIFSTCFAAPFLVLPPRALRGHADRARQAAPRRRLDAEHGLGRRTVRRRRADVDRAHPRHRARDPRGRAARRVRLTSTRCSACRFPNRVPGVPREVLDTRDSWPNPEDYDRQAAKLRDDVREEHPHDRQERFLRRLGREGRDRRQPALLRAGSRHRLRQGRCRRAPRSSPAARAASTPRPPRRRATKGVPVQVIPASFDELADATKSAARNQRLVDACDVLVAFWDGSSKGTRTTVERALDSGKEVHVFIG